MASQQGVEPIRMTAEQYLALFPANNQQQPVQEAVASNAGVLGSMARGALSSTGMLLQAPSIAAKAIPDALGMHPYVGEKLGRMAGLGQMQPHVGKALQGVADTIPAPQGFVEDVAHGIGTSVPLIGAGLAAAPLGPVAGSVAAGAGGVALELAGSYLEAKADGVDDETAARAALLSAPVGMLEAFGGAGRLVKTAGKAVAKPLMGRATAKAVIDLVARVNKETGGTLFRSIVEESVKSGASEAWTEGVQTLWSGEIAQRMYDEERKPLEEAVRAMLVGGTSGFLLGAFGGAIQQRSQMAKQADTQAGSEPARTMPTQQEPVQRTAEDEAALGAYKAQAKDETADLVSVPQEYAETVEFARKRGHTVRSVRTKLEGVEGWFDEDTGTIFIREGLTPEAAREVVIGHEFTHALKNRSMSDWASLRDEIAKADADGLGAMEAEAAAAYERVTGVAPSTDLNTEEGVAYYTQRVIYPWMKKLGSDPQLVERMVNDNRSTLRKVVEAVMDVLNSFGGKFKTRRAELQAIYKELGDGVRLDPQQAQALAQRYMAALNGLQAEFQAQQMQTGAPNYGAAQGVDTQAQEVGRALAEGEADLQANQIEQEPVAAFRSAAVEQPPVRQEPGMTPAQRRRSEKKARKAQQREAAQQTVTGLSVPKYVGDLVQLKDGRVGRVVETTGPQGSVRMRVRVDRQTFRRTGANAEVDLLGNPVEVLEPGGEVIVNEIDAELVERQEPRGELARQRYERGQVERASAKEPRFAVAAPKPSEQTTNQRLYSYLIDSLADVDAALPEGTKRERLRKSLTSRKLDTEWMPRQRAFVDHLKKSGLKIQDVDEVRIALSAPYINQLRGQMNVMRDADGNPILDEDGSQIPSKDAWSGYTDERSKKTLAKWKTDPRWPQMVEAVRQAQSFDKEFRVRSLESGDITQEQFDKLEAKYGREAVEKAGLADPSGRFESYYVPLRDAPSEEGLEGLGIGRGVALKGSPVKRALGRRTQATGSPTFYSLLDFANAISRAEKLESGRGFAAEIQEMNDPSFARVVKMPQKRGLVDGVVGMMPDYDWAERNNALPFKTKEGEVKAIIFGRGWEHIPAILKGEGMTKPIKGIGTLTRLMSASLTRWNIPFGPVNYIKDLGHVAMTAYSKYGWEFARGVVQRQPGVIRELNRARRTGVESERVKAYRDSGAEMASMGFQDYDAIAERLKSELNSGRVKDAARSLKEWVEGWNDMFENATRMAAFEQAIADGKSVQDAALIAKQEVALNFERRGFYGPYISSLYAFANAGLQGIDQVTQAVKTGRGKKAIIAIMATEFVLDQINRLTAGEEEDGANSYDAKPEWQKFSNLVFGNVLIPKPHGWAFFSSLGRWMSALSAGAMTPQEVALGVAVGATSSFNPFGGGPIAQQFAPTLIDPAVQAETNRGFTGKQIAPENLPFGVQKPASKLYWKGTPDLPVWFSKSLSELTQFDDSGEGLVEISPNMLEHWIKTLAGGVGSSLYSFGETVAPIARAELPRAQDTFLLKRFVGPNSPWGVDQRFSKLRRDITEAKTRYDELRKAGEGKRALEWRAANLPLFNILGMLDGIERQLSRIPNTPENEERRRSVKARLTSRYRELVEGS